MSNRAAQSSSEFGTPERPLEQIDGDQIHEWMAQLIQGDFQTRWDISKTLRHHPLGVLGPLLALLPQAQDDEELLWFIARLLGEIDHPEAMETLAGILQSSTTSEMQSVAALALANRGSSALPTLAALLEQPELRPLVVQVLSQIDSAEVVDVLLTVVGDGDAVVRRGAIEALSVFADPRIAPVLLLSLQDHDSAVRRFAVRAVGSRAAHLPGVNLEEAIAPLLHDFNSQVVEQAIIALGRLDTPLAREGLVQVLTGQRWPLLLQLQTARALGRSQSAEAIEVLLAQLDRCLSEAAQPTVAPTDGPQVSLPLAQEIIVVLGRVRAPQALAHQAAQALELRLPLIFNQTDGNLKRSTALALGQLGLASSFEALCLYLQDPSPGLTFHIVAALRRLDPAGGLARLQDLAAAQSSLAADGLLQAIAEWS